MQLRFDNKCSHFSVSLSSKPKKPRCDPIQHIYLSPDRFSKIDQHHSIANKMGDIFVRYDLRRPQRANNRRVDGRRLCYTLFDTDALAALDNCPDVIDSIPKLMRDEKNIKDLSSTFANRFATVS